MNLEHEPAGRELRQETSRAREIIMRHGWNAAAFQLVNPGITRWFSSRYDAVIGYVERSGFRVVAGAPVARHEDLGRVIEEFENATNKLGLRICYFGAEERMHTLLEVPHRHAMVVLGAQPAWHPQNMLGAFESKPSLRAQINRSRNKAVIVNEWASDRAESDPELQRVLNEWLASRGMAALHFLVEPRTLSQLKGRRIFVAAQHDSPIGFLLCSPIPARNGWLIEQFIRGNNAPNGTVELMLHAAISALAMSGAEYVTLGLSPLSPTGDLERMNPWWLQMLFRWVRAHGKRFYNFEGLHNFKAKFEPDHWDPIYAIAPGNRFGIMPLYAIAHAFTNKNPVRFLLAELFDAVLTEVRSSPILRKMFRRL
jgi:phosphatidylglycerol lysyltransferase